MLAAIWNLGSFIVAIGVLVAFHEFGHFFVARRLGIKVLKFSIGFGKPIWKRTAKDGVEYILASIPLGGYVKLLDEREGEVGKADLPHAFNRQPVWKRIAVFAAGPLFNFILAIVFYWILYVTGVPGIKSLLAEPPAGSIAAGAGLHSGDRVMDIGGEPTLIWTVLRSELLDQALAHRKTTALVQAPDGAQRSVDLDLTHVRVDPELLFEDIGMEQYDPTPPVIADLQPGGPAEQARFQKGDLIQSVNGVPVETFQAVQRIISQKAGDIVRIKVQRAGEPLELSVIVAGTTEGERTIGRIGVLGSMAGDDKLWQDLRAELRLSPLAAVPAALNQTVQISELTLKLLYRMLLGEVSVKNVSGPIQIAQAAGSSASAGGIAFLGFVAWVSVSIGIFNLLPIPVLDGGQILFGLIEAVKGSPLSERVQIAGQQIGLVLLALLMGLAFYNDIMRHIG